MSRLLTQSYVMNTSLPVLLLGPGLTSGPIFPDLIISLGSSQDYSPRNRIDHEGFFLSLLQPSMAFICWCNMVWTTSRSLTSSFQIPPRVNFPFIPLHILDFEPVSSTNTPDAFTFLCLFFTLIPHPQCLYSAFLVMETLSQFKYHPLMKTRVQLKVTILSFLLP